MEIAASIVIAAPPAQIWAALNDPAVLCACIPGCSSLTGTAATGFDAVVDQKIGPLHARFNGRLSLRDAVPEQSWTIIGEGVGGHASAARGAAHVRLEPGTDGTRLDYRVEVEVGERLAKLGGWIIRAFARGLADSFFRRFKAAVEAAPIPGPDAAPNAGGANRPTA